MDLTARMQRLEDERDILTTLYSYAHGLDYGPEDDFVDVFTPDGEWRRMPSTLPQRSFSGESGLRTMYRDHTHAPEYFHKHVVVNAVVTVTGVTATARSYLVFVPADSDGPYVRAFSRCTDELMRCSDGRWRIRRRRAELEAWAEREFPPAPWSNTPPVAR
jgi:ketosteroid isomerase-like protein